MRCNNNLGILQEWMISPWRLFLEYVESSACNNPFINCLHKRQLIDNSASRTIDDPHAGLHHFKLCPGYHMPGFWCERGMHRHEIGIANNFIYSSELNSHLGCSLLAHKWIITQNSHPEGNSALGDLGSDSTQSQYPQS